MIADLKDEGRYDDTDIVDIASRRPRFECCDLARDPNEVENLAERPALAGMVRGLAERIR